jgi:RimJ/RimL family protein N-acetyltransferase
VGQAAGLLQVGRADFAGAVAEWGIVLGRSHRGTGAASEAARLMAGFAFETLGVHRLETRASRISPGSISLLRKLGAVHEAHLRQSFAHGSEVVDDDLWAILKSDWPGRQIFSGERNSHLPPAQAH